MKLRKQFQSNYKGTPWEGEPGVSKTVPDQNLTIGELLERHSRGVSLGAPELKGEYFDTEIPRFDDLTDALEYKKNLNKKVKYYDNEIKKQKAKKAQSIKEKSEVKDSQAETVAKPKTMKSTDY